MGITAALTLGNKKAVDILAVRSAGDFITVEVKGVAKHWDWPADNITTKNPKGHFVVLVSFEGRISERSMPTPKVWVIPFPDLKQFIKRYVTRTNVSRARISKMAEKFENAWHLIK